VVNHCPPSNGLEIIPVLPTISIHLIRFTLLYTEADIVIREMDGLDGQSQFPAEDADDAASKSEINDQE
jgi:hypothetical protein